MAHVTPLDDAVRERLEAVRLRLRRAGGTDAVRIVAVTKGFGGTAVAAAVAAGLLDVGESYASELATKALASTGGTAPIRWHFIGRLQSNKVKRLSSIVHLWQSVDRTSVVAELARHAPGAAVLVQVNVSGESQKGGCDPTDAPALVAEAASAGLDVRGLMCVAAAGGNDAARPGFRLLRSVADDLGLQERSMGMSGDLEAAVEEGATIVRLGTALLGPRVVPGGPGPRGGGGRLQH